MARLTFGVAGVTDENANPDVRPHQFFIRVAIRLRQQTYPYPPRILVLLDGRSILSATRRLLRAEAVVRVQRAAGERVVDRAVDFPARVAVVAGRRGGTGAVAVV